MNILKVVLIMCLAGIAYGWEVTNPYLSPNVDNNFTIQQTMVGILMSGNLTMSGDINLLGTITASKSATAAAADGTAYYSHITSAPVSPAAAAEVTNLLGRYNWWKGDNANFIASGVEGVAASYGSDESMTGRGVYGRFYVAPGATMRTGVGGEFSARASYSGGTAITAESGTGFIGARIWMAPYFLNTSTANITNYHGLWIYNEHTTMNIANAIKIGTAGGLFDKDINLQNGETIDNAVDGTIKLDATTVSMTGDVTISSRPCAIFHYDLNASSLTQIVAGEYVVACGTGALLQSSMVDSLPLSAWFDTTADSQGNQNRIRYVGKKIHKMYVSCDISWDAAAACVLYIQLSKNGTPIPRTKQHIAIAASAKESEPVTSAIVNMTTNDYLEMLVMTPDGTDASIHLGNINVFPID